MKAVKKLVAGLGLTVALGLGATAAQASEGGCGTYKTVEVKTRIWLVKPLLWI